MRALALVALLFAAAAARAEEPDLPPRFGMLVDAGVPDGLVVGITYRRLPAVRLWAGPAWNYLSVGVAGGIAIVPFEWAISPALSVEGGRYFGTDLNRVVSGAPQEVKPLLKDVDYLYGAAHLGVEIGSQRGFAFTVRAGLAWIRARARGTATTSDSSTGAQVNVSDPRVRATVPSVKIGVQYAF